MTSRFGRRFFRALVTGVVAMLALVAPWHSARGEQWFDAGGADSTIVYAPDDTTCFEVFPPGCMGPLPALSFVAEAITLHPCLELRWPGQVCGREGVFVRGFRIVFNDGGCGCGGYVEEPVPTTLQLTYDPAIVAAAGLSPGELRLVYNDERTPGWRPVPDFEVAADRNALVARIRGKILGLREYAIVGPGFVPARSTSWSALKSQRR